MVIKSNNYLYLVRYNVDVIMRIVWIILSHLSYFCHKQRHVETITISWCVVVCCVSELTINNFLKDQNRREEVGVQLAICKF